MRKQLVINNVSGDREKSRSSIINFSSKIRGFFATQDHNTPENQYKFYFDEEFEEQIKSFLEKFNLTSISTISNKNQ